MAASDAEVPVEHNEEHEPRAEPSMPVPRLGDGQRAGLPREEMPPEWRRWQRREVEREATAVEAGRGNRTLDDPHA